MDLMALANEVFREYAKPVFVVPDNMVEAFRKEFEGIAIIVPVSETRLSDSAEGGI